MRFKERIVLSVVLALCSTACLADSSVVADDQPEEALDVDASTGIGTSPDPVEKVVLVCPLGAPICIYIDVDDGACPWQGCDPWPKPPPPLANEVDGGVAMDEGDPSDIFVPICPGAPWCPPLPLPPCPYIGHPEEGKTCRGPNGPVMPPTWPGPSLAPGDDDPLDEPGPTDTTG